MKFLLFLLGFTSVSCFQLNSIAKTLSQPGKGILAADESTTTIGNRLESVGVPNSLENRIEYRKLLFTTPDLEKYISGAILYSETLENPELMSILNAKGIIPGIKLDSGLKKLPGSSESWCSGMDTLEEKAQKYYKLGARFAKWRAVFSVSKKLGYPSDIAISENCWGLARYAKTVQEAGLVPIVEPEILMDGDHSLEDTIKIQEFILHHVYDYLDKNKVDLQGTLLKPSFTAAGIDNSNHDSTLEIAKATIKTMKKSVPIDVPGIMFLSGGFSEEKASQILNLINQHKPNGLWSTSFSFGRALQSSCLKTWKGKEENISKAQQELFARVKANSEASLGNYQDQEALDESLFVTNYTY